MLSDLNLIVPIILCGGSGTRLWPLSRKTMPKPFLPLIGETTLFQQAVARVSSTKYFGPPIIVAGVDHCDTIDAQLAETADYKIAVEPLARNTAPAIALAASLLPPDTVMLVCPSDHYIANQDAFRDAALLAAELARHDWMVSFGITPHAPETGYGYLHRGAPLKGGFQIRRFVEKPGLETALTYLETGEYSWNGGIFAFRAGKLMNELADHRPKMARLVAQSVKEGQDKGNRFHPAFESFAAIEGESIDYAVMENTSSAAMVPAQMGWSDIGNWGALKDALTGENQTIDKGQNIKKGRVDLEDCRRVLALTDGPRISVVGLEDVCVVVSDGEVLVTTRDGAQKVGKLPGASNQ